VLGDDLKAVPGRDSQGLHQCLLDSVGDGTDLIGTTSADHVEAYQRHVSAPIVERHQPEIHVGGLIT
jgi:hypothetical protein